MVEYPEEWRPVVGDRKGYEVSNHGRIRNGSRLLKMVPARRAYGATYHQVALGRGPRYLVHRLVAEAFIGPCPAGMEVLHADDNGSNNCVHNLSYGTHARNMAALRGRRRLNPTDRSAKLTLEQEAEVIRLANTREMKQADIAARFGITQSHVSHLKNGDYARRVEFTTTGG